MEDVYNTVKSSSCLQRTFDAFSLQDFITLGSITAHHRLKCLSLVPYYVAQMKWCTQKWDRCDNQGVGTKVVNTCHQLIRVVGMGLYHSMADVKSTVRSNCGSDLFFTNLILIGGRCDTLCEQCSDHANFAAWTDQSP